MRQTDGSAQKSSNQDHTALDTIANENVTASPSRQPLPSLRPVSEPKPTNTPQVPTRPKVIRPGASGYVDRRTQIKFSWPIMFFVLFSVGLLALLITALYLFFYEPRIVLADYIRKLADVKTGTMTGTMNFKPLDSSKPTDFDISTVSDISKAIPTFINTSTITFDLQYNIRDANDPHFDTKFTINTQGVSTKVDTIVGERSLYAKFNSNPLFSLAGINISSEWHKMTLPQDLFKKSSCTIQDQENSILSRNVLRFMPVKSVRREGLFETVQGHRTIHTTGEVNAAKLRESLDQANINLPPECRITPDESQFQNFSAFYDLYSSKDFDRLSLTIIDRKAGRETNVVLDSTNYNSDITISEPAQSKSIKSINDIFAN